MYFITYLDKDGKVKYEVRNAESFHQAVLLTMFMCEDSQILSVARYNDELHGRLLAYADMRSRNGDQ